MSFLKNKIQSNSTIARRSFTTVAVVVLFAVTAISSPFVYAATLQQQIDSLNAENGQKKDAQNQLGTEAASLSDTIAGLQAQINAAQNRINENESEMAKLKTQIAAAEAELARQRDLLGQTIKAMYLEGEITPAEMVFTSKNLSEYLDKQQYRESVNSKIKTTLDKITQLKLDLNAQKDKVEKLLAEQKELQAQLAAQRAENNRLLSLNQAQQGALDSQIKANSGKISELRKQQAAENARLFARSGGFRSNVPDTTGYPWANYRSGSWTHGGSCYYGDDIDPWGMCYRQCVSYAAWKTYKTHGYNISRWGDAKNWDDRARSAGLPVDGNPQPGDIAVSDAGTWGHVMFVESVSGNTVNISQYNAGLDGKFSTGSISKSGLEFIHFR